MSGNSFIEKTQSECKESLLLKKKRRRRPNLKYYPALDYPDLDKFNKKTFQILYDDDLSSEMEGLLNSFQKTYLYYAIDAILNALELDLKKRNNLLAVFSSPAISLDNTSSVDFFDIWIDEVDVHKVLKVNRFLTSKVESSYQITIKLLYEKKNITKIKKKILW